MRIEVHGIEGELAGDPERALDALASIAEADGADRDDWLTKAVASQGATAVSVPVRRQPRYQITDDFQREAARLYDRALTLMRSAIQERLAKAARDADTSKYRDMA